LPFFLFCPIIYTSGCIVGTDSDIDDNVQRKESSDKKIVVPAWEDMALSDHNNVCDLDNSLFSSLRSDLNERYSSITFEDVNHAEKLYGEHSRRLVIKNNVLYGRDGSDHAVVGVSKFVEDMLLKILKKVKVPDIDFVLNCSDFPQVLSRSKTTATNQRYNNNNNYNRPDAPVVSMCGSKIHNDIIVPTYALAQTVTGRRYAVGEETTNTPPWKQRKDRLVWRGSDSNRDRFAFNLIANSKQFVEKTNVGINKMVRRAHDPVLHGPVKDTMPEYDFGTYKWIANIDGAVAAYRMPFVAALGSSIVMQESIYLEHWYLQLKPWKHYVPMTKDFSDLGQALEWLQNHDTEAQKIGQNMREFAFNNLQPHHIECFWYVFLYEYAGRMTYEPQILNGMVKSV